MSYNRFLTSKQFWLLDSLYNLHVDGRGWAGPTEIARSVCAECKMWLGEGTLTASWASKTLQRLAKRSIVLRSGGQYRIPDHIMVVIASYRD